MRWRQWAGSYGNRFPAATSAVVLVGEPRMSPVRHSEWTRTSVGFSRSSSPLSLALYPLYGDDMTALWPAHDGSMTKLRVDCRCERRSLEATDPACGTTL